MTKKTLLLFAAIVLLAACKKDTPTVTTPTVIDVNVRSSVDGSVISGVTIKLLTDDHRINGNELAAATSGADGKVEFTITPGTKYYLYAYAKTLTNPEATYIFTGKYTAQRQITFVQFVSVPTPNIGDDMYDDINGDGIINLTDKVIPVNPTAQGSTTNVNFIIKPQ